MFHPDSLKWNSPCPCKHMLGGIKIQHRTVTPNLQNLSRSHLVSPLWLFLILTSSVVLPCLTLYLSSQYFPLSHSNNPFKTYISSSPMPFFLPQFFYLPSCPMILQPSTWQHTIFCWAPSVLPGVGEIIVLECCHQEAVNGRAIKLPCFLASCTRRM